MTPNLPRGYRLQPDGIYTRRVDFDVPGRPDVTSMTILRRTSTGKLLKATRSEWRKIENRKAK